MKESFKNKSEIALCNFDQKVFDKNVVIFVRFSGAPLATVENTHFREIHTGENINLNL